MEHGAFIELKKPRRRIYFKKDQLDDPIGLSRDVFEIGHYGVGDYEAVVNTETDLDYVMSVVREGYRYNVDLSLS